MDKKIPSKPKLNDIVKQVLSSHLKINSQEELSRLVLKRLKRENKDYVASPVRVKRIALDIPEIEVKAKTKKAVHPRHQASGEQPQTQNPVERSLHV